MYWNQDETPDTVTIPDDTVDILFSIDCKQLPVDHAYALSEALRRIAPWMADEPELAVHSIHAAGSQNGWERPAHGTDNLLHLSHRTKLTIRTPIRRRDQLLEQLSGCELDVCGYPILVGTGKVKSLSKETTLLSRYVVADATQDEEAFIDAAAVTLAQMGIKIRKALCGKSTSLAIDDGVIYTRALMLADLTTDESFKLQRIGLGPNRLMGCGVFIPHKGIDAVG